MHYLQITFNNITSAQQEILIAQLSDAGFEGFEQTSTNLEAFVPEHTFDNDTFNTAIATHSGNFTKQKIIQQNWNEVWEKSFDPVIIGNFCSIRASFHTPVGNTKHEIIITPKMSFGTGHHPTTLLMISIMQLLDLSQKRVLDFGTGTGVLAILAEKCGARSIMAIDNDTWSIQNANENTQANHCNNIQVVNAASLSDENKFDVILANVNKHVITTQLPDFAQHLHLEGVLIVSGLLQTDLAFIAEKILLQQLKIVSVAEENDWMAVTCRF